MAGERPRPCTCAPELTRSVLFPEGRDFSALACSACGALVAFYVVRGESQPHVDPEPSYHRVSLTAEVEAWLGAFPRYVPYSVPWCWLPASARFATVLELERAEDAARVVQMSLGTTERLERVGLPAPVGELADFQQVASIATVSPLELLELAANGTRLVAQLASERLAKHESLATELAALIRSGGAPAAAASRAFFRLRPSDPATRHTVAEALGERLLVLCEQPSFDAEAELSEHVLALLTLGADAVPARAALTALRTNKLFQIRSTLRDQVAKIEAALPHVD